MSVPTTRQQFKDFCLRRLGHPIIKINVTDEQIDDRLDEALAFYWDYHFDGTEKTYYKHLITATDITNKYITLPENIIGAVNIFPIGESYSTNSMFSIRYQIYLNDLYTLTTPSMLPYFSTLQHLSLIEQLLIGQQPIRYNRHRNILYIDMDWSLVKEGNYFLVEAYEIVDPETYTNVWKDRWLMRYCTALIKRQWSMPLKKYAGLMNVGGVQFDGQRLYEEAEAEIAKLEEEMIYTFSLPVSDFIG